MSAFKPRTISSLETVTAISDNDILIIQSSSGVRRTSVRALENALLAWLGANTSGDLSDISGLALRVTELEDHTMTGLTVADGLLCCEYEEG